MTTLKNLLKIYLSVWWLPSALCPVLTFVVFLILFSINNVQPYDIGTGLYMMLHLLPYVLPLCIVAFAGIWNFRKGRYHLGWINLGMLVFVLAFMGLLFGSGLSLPLRQAVGISHGTGMTIGGCAMIFPCCVAMAYMAFYLLMRNWWIKWIARPCGMSRINEFRDRLCQDNPDYCPETVEIFFDDEEAYVEDIAFTFKDMLLDLHEIKLVWKEGLNNIKALGNIKAKSLYFFNRTPADLSPLAKMPIKSLALLYDDTGFKPDLSVLRQLKLKKLGICECSLEGLDNLSNMKLREFKIWGCNLNNPSIGPLRVMPLKTLWLCDFELQDLSPLKGLPLQELIIGNTNVKDISALAGMRLKKLEMYNSKVSDLQPLAGMRLTELNISNTEVADLSPLKGMRLKILNANNTKFIDLSPLKGMPLFFLECASTNISDLSPLQGMPLTWLNIANTSVTDVSPLKDMKHVCLQVMDCNITNLSCLNLSDTELFE